MAEVSSPRQPELTPPELTPAKLSFFSRLRRHTPIARRHTTLIEDHESPLWPTRAKAHIERFQEKLKLRRQQKKETAAQDASNTIVAEMAAGSPAAVMAGSTFLRDGQGHRRIPVLPEQLKVRFVKTEEGRELADATTGQRHPEFHIYVEYGNGPTRRSWIIVRSLRALASLHLAYKADLGKERVARVPHDSRIRLPDFPTSVFPYLRKLRATAWARELQGIKEHEMPSIKEEQTSPRSEHHPDDPPNSSDRRPSRTMRRLSTYSENLFASTAKKSEFQKKQRQALEKWLQDMINFLSYKPQINRLCRFLELSVSGMRLAPEGDFHGKEGALTLKKDSSRLVRKALASEQIKERVVPKWWSVHPSYLLCTETAEEAKVQDVILMDSNFKVSLNRPKTRARDQSGKEMMVAMGRKTRHPQRHSIKVKNSERRVTLRASGSSTASQFEESLKIAASSTIWTQKNRYESFAPVHHNTYCLGLVDGQEAFWNIARAISKAQDVIYMHGWWFSPEVFLKRPSIISEYWRLDRLLYQKAEEGVKIFIIMYRNVDSAIPIDSTHSKKSFQTLHPNIFVQRSPNQIRQGTFFWAHHEKVVIVDHNICFVGGIDLCFGRYDDAHHRLADDKPTGKEKKYEKMDKNNDTCQIWPGKDYSNPRVRDFYELGSHLLEMYDRSKTPRMPWHDISFQMVGHVARDASRHFVQRWNFILRQRNITRPTPLLIPPPEFKQKDLDRLGLNGTCDVQLLRSSSMWSMGTEKTEHSIMDAYIDAIENSEHLIYIENQFFITSTKVGNRPILNGIGDALVERILRAHEDDEDWKAIILIPLVPGFEGDPESRDGTSIRFIMQCQFRSICRGENSIFGRLRENGINPSDYIEFYSLRSWGHIGPNRGLVTEQLYIHAKVMIVDDRTAICGSANINERSMLGNRDSEVACIVRDKDMIQSTMNGKPYEVGVFPHSLRMRLMREHLGIDINELNDEQYFIDEGTSTVTPDDSSRSSSSEDELSYDDDDDEEHAKHATLFPTVNGAPPKEARRESVGGKSVNRSSSMRRIIHGSRSRSGSLVRVVDEKFTVTSSSGVTEDAVLPPYLYPLVRTSSFELGLPMRCELPPLPHTDDSDIGGPALHHSPSVRKEISSLGSKIAKMKRPRVSKDCMRDPLRSTFYNGVWQAVAENNTLLFRTVFNCEPDSRIKTFKQHREATAAYNEFITSSNQGIDSTSGISKPMAEHLLGMVQGHLVTWPYDWLAKEEATWYTTVDQLAPLEIYS